MGYTVVFDGKRECLRCGIVKPLSEFHQYRYTTRQGNPGIRYDGRCWACQIERSMARPRKTEKRWSEYRRHHPVPSSPELKICNTCGKEKPRTDYYRNPRAADGLQYDCKDCRKNSSKEYQTRNIAIRRQWSKRSQLKKYGLTTDQFDQMVQDSHGLCATCGKHEKRLHVDHNHTTGYVRGLLCLHCNISIGNAHDSSTVLRAMADYLDKEFVS